MKIGILNAYDARNMGDQAIVIAQMAWLRERFGDVDIRVFSHHWGPNGLFFGRASVESPLYSPPYGTRTGKLVRPFLDWAAYNMGGRSGRKKFAEFDSCDIYALCGGGYLYSSLNPFLSRNLLLLCETGVMAARTGKPVIQFPQSYGPLTKAPDIASVLRLARSLEKLTPRCPNSVEFIERHGLADKCVMVPDIVLMLRDLCPAYYTHRFRRSGLGIAPVDFSFAIHESPELRRDYLEKLTAVAVEFHRTTGEGVYLFLQVVIPGKDDDSVVALELAEMLRQRGVPVEIVMPQWSLRRYVREFQHMRFFIGSRMHACIFSLLAETPTVGLAYQPKFYGLFNHLGLDGWVSSIESWRTDWLRERIVEALADERTMHEDLRARIDRAAMLVADGMERALPLALRMAPEPVKATPERRDRPQFSIVTPSYNQLEWLRLCAASVADQAGVSVEHIIQDAGTPGIGDESFTPVAEHGAEMQPLRAPGRTDYVRQLVVEKDSGMYDAINRGFRRARGEIVAWLNCDEQYLPGTLRRVAELFRAHPDVDVLFGDALLLDEAGKILSYRRSVKPALLHTRLAHLATLSCAMFFRRSLLDQGLFLDTRWKTIADAVWVAGLIEKGVRMAVLPEPLSAFTMTRVNLGQSSLLFAEMEKWRGAMPTWKRGMTPLVIGAHRVRKMLGGAYGNRDVNTAFYTRLSGGRRKEAAATGVSFGWPDAAAPGTEGGLAARPRFTRRRSSYDVAFQNKMPDPKTEKQRETLATAAAFVVTLLIILLDLQIKELTIAPFFCTLVILTLTFLLPPARLTIIALALMPVVLFSLRFSQPFRPGQAIDWMRIALRLGSFGIACSLAILFSAYRLRSARLASQTLDVLRRMPAPVIVSDAAGIVRFANRAASELLGRAQNELEDASYLALLMSDEDEGTASRAYRAAFEGSTDKTHEIVLSPRAGAGGKLTAQTATIGERENRLLVTLVNPASMRRAG